MDAKLTVFRQPAPEPADQATVKPVGAFGTSAGYVNVAMLESVDTAAPLASVTAAKYVVPGTGLKPKSANEEVITPADSAATSAAGTGNCASGGLTVSISAT